MKNVGIIKRRIATCLIFLMCINSFAAVVSDNDGSAFITKAEFDSLKNNFQSQIDSYNQSIDAKIDGAIASYLAGIKMTTKESILNQSYKNYGDRYVKFFSASQVNNDKIAWEEAKNLYWIGWIFTYQNFLTQTPVFCPTFMNYNMTSPDENYPFRSAGTGGISWAAINALDPLRNSNYKCINSPRILECQTLGENKYYLNTTACYEYANITNAAWWNSAWLPGRGSTTYGSAGYKTSNTGSFSGPMQFSNGSKYSNNAAKFEVREFRWEKTDLKWADFDIPYNKIDLKYDVLQPDDANTYSSTGVNIASGSYIHVQTYNMGPADHTYTDRWRDDGGYFYTKAFKAFDMTKHAYQKNDSSSHLYEGLRLCANPGKDGELEVPFMVEKNKGTKCKIRFKYGPFTNTNKTGNVKIKDIDGSAVDSEEIEVTSYGTAHKLTLEIDKNYKSNDNIYAMLIPYDGSSEYVTSDAEMLEYVQGIKFTGNEFEFTIAD